MSLALDLCLNRQIGRNEAPTEEQESRLNVAVVFTSLDPTMVALERAGGLAESLGADITLVVPQIVPYPLPLTSPPVQLEFQERRFREIAAKSPVDIRVQLHLCRDELGTLTGVLKPRSLVVIGGRRRFWPTREKAMVRKLRGAGHDVIYTEE